MIFTLSIALAHLTTNFDNLALFLTLAPVAGTRRTAFGFMMAQIITLLIAFLAGSGLQQMPNHLLGYLGIVPIILGLSALVQSADGDDTTPHPGSGAIWGLTLAFLALSADSFTLITAFLADSHHSFDGAVLAGAMISATALITLAALGGKLLRAEGRTRRFVERIAPFVMILSGLYILSNTLTDSI